MKCSSAYACVDACVNSWCSTVRSAQLRRWRSSRIRSPPADHVDANKPLDAATRFRNEIPAKKSHKRIDFPRRACPALPPKKAHSVSVSTPARAAALTTARTALAPWTSPGVLGSRRSRRPDCHLPKTLAFARSTSVLCPAKWIGVKFGLGAYVDC